MISTYLRLDKLGAFVSLRKIQLQDPISNTMLLPLTSPYLDSVEIKITKRLDLNEIGVASFLQSVASQSPRLRSLTIKGPFTRITLEVLLDFINLHHLTIHIKEAEIPVYFLRQVASSMPFLRRLVFSCHLAWVEKATNTHSVFQLPFPSLEILSVACNSTRLEDLLDVLDAPLLKSVSLHFIDVDGQMHKFFEKNWYVLKDKVHQLTIRTLDPSLSFLKSFEALRNVSLSAWSGAISMRDMMDTFEYNASWSHSLNDLRLRQTNPTNPLDCMSIAALYLIVDACPNLELLEISIHHPDKPKMQIEQDRQPHGLKTLVFHNLPGDWDDTISLATEFVSFLDHLFLSMDVPEYIAGLQDRAARLAWWKGVQDIWRMCQTIKDRQNDKRPSSV